VTAPAVGFHASHEQFRPAELLELVGAAERTGFEAAMSSDHLAPWSEQQGESGNAWPWLGAAMQRTSLPFGVVCAPGPRNHPLILAQTIATLLDLGPGRLWVAVGSGIASNEYMVGEPWPPKAERMARLEESIEILRALWAGEEVAEAEHFTLREARLWTPPPEPPPLIAAALTEETARWAAAWADGLITVGFPAEQLEGILAAYRDAGGTGKAYLQSQISWAPDEAAAREGAHHQWRNNILAPAQLEDTPTVAALDAAGEMIGPDQLDDAIRISADPSRHVEWLREDAELGFDTVFLHNVNREQARFVEAFGERVLPELR
jgi:coenzyme F420-dependent glucose-6-phosphate dehydrogenase